MNALRLIALAMILLVGAIVAVHGQTPSSLPPGMTQDQFDALVDAIGKAVVVKLKTEGVVPAPRSAAAPSQPGVASNVVADELAGFLEKTEHVPRAAPTLT
jgi:moderate conductance mechanosensitive channel